MIGDIPLFVHAAQHPWEAGLLGAALTAFDVFMTRVLWRMGKK